MYIYNKYIIFSRDVTVTCYLANVNNPYLFLNCNSINIIICYNYIMRTRSRNHNQLFFLHSIVISQFLTLTASSTVATAIVVDAFYYLLSFSIFFFTFFILSIFRFFISLYT